MGGRLPAVRLAWGMVAAALLPARHRERVAFRLDLPLAAWAAALSVLAMTAGGIAWALGWLTWMERATGMASDAAARQVSVPNRGALMFFGPVQGMAYLFTPAGAALGYLTSSGFLRSAVWWATREVPGDPLVSLCFAGASALRRLRARHRAGTLLREPPADRVRETELGLEIVRAEARSDLAPGASVEVDGRFYHVVEVRQVRQGKRTVIVHDLRELPSQSVLRGFVRYR